MTHLSERSYRLLLQGALPPAEARQLARHLEEVCDVCEALLASLPGADAVDGRVDRALAALGPAGARGGDLEFARIERRLALAAGGPPVRRRLASAVSAALAAVLLAAGLAGLVAPRPGGEPAGWDGAKGVAARAIGVRLRFLVVAPSPGGAPALEKGVPGQPVAAGASLQFEVEVSRAAHVALVRVPARGAPEVFWDERVEGRRAVTVDGRPAAYPLAELSGPQRFVLVASEQPLEAERAARAAAALAPPGRVTADHPVLEGLSLDVVEVDVR